MARLLLIRHGQIAANLTQHWHGSTDSPLTERGRREVAMLSAHVREYAPSISAIYASPLQRTRDTANGIAEALDLPLVLDHDLREFGIGELEGMHFKVLSEELGFFKRMADDHEFAPTGGESIGAVARRVTGALQRIAAQHAGQQVIAVGHGAAFGIALGSLLHNDPLKWTEFGIRNCSITELELDPTPRVLRMNDVAHLQ